MMVGGEESQNEEAKKRHQEKIEHVEARKRRLAGDIPRIACLIVK